MKYILTILLLLNTLLCQDCPKEGDAITKKAKELNVLKNRNTFPKETDIDSSITIENLLADGNDVNRFSESKAVVIIGYCVDVKIGSVESCNCHAKEHDKRDTHIELTTSPMNTGKTNTLVVEVTPYFREIMKQRGIDWTTKALRRSLLGRWIKITGWLLFDSEHTGQAENTAPDRPRNWRKTAWEVHPITDIAITRKPLP